MLTAYSNYSNIFVFTRTLGIHNIKGFGESFKRVPNIYNYLKSIWKAQHDNAFTVPKSGVDTQKEIEKRSVKWFLLWITHDIQTQKPCLTRFWLRENLMKNLGEGKCQHKLPIFAVSQKKLKAFFRNLLPQLAVSDKRSRFQNMMELDFEPSFQCSKIWSRYHGYREYQHAFADCKI